MINECMASHDEFYFFLIRPCRKDLSMDSFKRNDYKCWLGAFFPHKQPKVSVIKSDY